MNRCLVFTIALFVFSGFGSQAAGNETPNIIIFMADDLGYGDLGCYGSTLNTTPNIDRLAERGVRFTDFSTSSWCAPSRRALMTGCDAHRPGMLGGDHRVLAERVTIAEMLGERGYATALVGKWHLGMRQGLHPLDQGFDAWYGTAGSNDWDGPPPNYESFRNAPESAWKTPIFRDRERLGICPQSEFTKRYTEETQRLIREHKAKPFFIFVSHNMPHVPIFASERFKGKSKNGVYGDVLMELDWSMGEIQKTLEANDLQDNTLILFTSDNGPWSMFPEYGGIAHPLRGQKTTTWEGGGRVPLIACWPNKIKPGVSDAFMFMTDLYATFARFTASEVKPGQAIDSLDMSNVFLDAGESPRAKQIYYQNQTPMAFRSGEYKIHFWSRERTRNPETGAIEKNVRMDPPRLYNLSEDPGEKRNIADKHPEIVDRMTAEHQSAIQAIADWEPYH